MSPLKDKDNPAFNAGKHNEEKGMIMHTRYLSTLSTRRVIAAATTVLAAAVALAMIPSAAFGREKETTVSLICDDSQITVQAPTTAALAYDGSGEFICPDADDFQFTNMSIFPICIQSWSVTKLNNSTNPMTDTDWEDEKTDDTANAYYLLAQPGEYDEALNAATSCTATLKTAWNIGIDEALGVTLSGCIKNISGIDFTTAQDILKITWVIGAAQNTVA